MEDIHTHILKFINSCSFLRLFLNTGHRHVERFGLCCLSFFMVSSFSQNSPKTTLLLGNVQLGLEAILFHRSGFHSPFENLKCLHKTLVTNWRTEATICEGISHTSVFSQLDKNHQRISIFTWNFLRNREPRLYKGTWATQSCFKLWNWRTVWCTDREIALNRVLSKYLKDLCKHQLLL